MHDFDYPLEPLETLRIRRVNTAPRVPNKGKGVYWLARWRRPILEKSGWELEGFHKKKSRIACFLSPGSMVAGSFVIDSAIPDEEAILRLAASIIRFATRPSGPGNPAQLGGCLEHFSCNALHSRETKFGSGIYFGVSRCG